MTKTSLPHAVVVGVDTHKDVHVTVAIDQDGRVISHFETATKQRGFVELDRWASSLAPVMQFGIEGTNSYGAGLFRYLREQGCKVTEIRGPNRQLRRNDGKSIPKGSASFGSTMRPSRIRRLE